MLSMKHRAVIHSETFSSDVLEILVEDDFCEPLKKIVWVEKAIFTQATMEAFESLEGVESELISDIFDCGISEVAFQNGLISLRIEKTSSWDETLPRMDDVLKTHHIPIKYEKGSR